MEAGLNLALAKIPSRVSGTLAGDLGGTASGSLEGVEAFDCGAVSFVFVYGSNGSGTSSTDVDASSTLDDIACSLRFFVSSPSAGWAMDGSYSDMVLALEDVEYEPVFNRRRPRLDNAETKNKLAKR